MEAINGEEGLVIAQREIPDLIITDVMMPRMNGMEAFQKIHQESPDIPALFVSGYQEKIDSVNGLPDGVVEIVGKPISPKDLVRKIKAILT